MKTIGQTLKEVLGETGYQNLTYRFLVEKAMKEYASQAIDRCAESAKTKNDDFYKGVINKQSILNVKSELK